ncbi:helix-turn-helix domain-containing protein [Ruania alba]|uniref:Regulatory protein, luxR family n=1 Tax=Ruania alba TaxID=648782 RepID=A0A1H5M575_9MICO|nr:helix-turn-helix transcriptional regulator [Ruania alba]SEE84360.1 regulatory protein, luxR family [Ruania alba]
MLDRDAAMAELDLAAPGSIVLVDAPPGGGKATLVQRWLEARGRSARWLPVAESAQHARRGPSAGSALEVLLVRTDTVDQATLRVVRAQSPTAVVIVLSTAGWPTSWRSTDLAPDRVISGTTLAFTATDLQALAASRGLDISDRVAARVIAATGGLPGAVAAALESAPGDGRWDSSALASGCDHGVALLQAEYSAELLGPLLLLALADGGCSDTARILWSAVQDGPAVLSGLRGAGLVVEADTLDMLRLPVGLRDAFRRLADREPGLRDDVIARAVSQLVERGRYDDLVCMASVPALRPAVLPQVAERWERLVDVPAPVLLEAVSARGRRAGLDPHLAIAAARAYLDITHTGHSGHVSSGDVSRAQALLDGPAVRALTDESARRTTVMLRAILDRANGHADRSATTLETLLRSAEPEGELTVSIRVHAGLSAFAASRISAARGHCTTAMLRAGDAERAQLAHTARDLAALLNQIDDDPRSWWRQNVPRTSTTAAIGDGPSRELLLLDAVLRADIARMRALEPRLRPEPVAEPRALALIQVQIEALALNALQRPEEGIEVLGALRATIGPTSPRERRMLVAAHADLLAAAGRGRHALDVLEEMAWHEVPDGIAGPPPLDLALCRARVLLTLERFDEVPTTVHRALTDIGRTGGRFVCWAHVLLSLAARAMGRDDEADRCLEMALVAGCEAEILFPFLRQGPQSLDDLISAAQHLDLDDETRRFVARLVQVREAVAGEPGGVALSERQRHVLRLLHEAPNTRTLARWLAVSESTAKAHLAQVYRKLGVSNRVAALRVGRARGLLEEPRSISAPSPTGLDESTEM